MIIDPYQFQTVRLSQIVRESKRAVSLRVTGTTPYAFQPGQHAIVRVTLQSGATLVRQYSFASAPSSGDLWLTIVETPGGAVSTWANQHAHVGDILEISQPFNGPLVHKLPRGKICMIAGGSGIVPLMSHLREQRLHPTDSSISLLYSSRSESTCYQIELVPTPSETIVTRFTDQQPRFTSREIELACQDAKLVLICGSRQFVKAMLVSCSRVVEPLLIHCEAFSL